MRPKRAAIVDIANNVYVCFMTTNVDCRAGIMIAVAILGRKPYIRPRCVAIVAQQKALQVFGENCIVGVDKKIGSSQKSTLELSKPATRGAKTWNFASVVVALWDSLILFQTTLLGLYKSHQNS